MSTLTSSPGSSLAIPAVAGIALGDWEATRAAMASGATLEFSQPWRAEQEADFAPGRLWLGVNAGELVVYARLQDDAPANRARVLNEPTWSTGDALEFFFQAEGRPGYYEFHVTPENVHLQLHIPGREAFLRRLAFTTWAMEGQVFDSATRVDAVAGEWEAVMRIKLAMVLDLPRADNAKRFRYSFSRYDYQPGREKPVLSATAPLVSGPDFHNIAEWSWAEVVGG